MGDASSTAFMNLTTSSYVDVDLKPLASAVVFRLARELGWAATNGAAATIAATATKRRIRIILRRQCYSNCGACHGSQETRRSGDAGATGEQNGCLLTPAPTADSSAGRCFTSRESASQPTRLNSTIAVG